MSTYNIPLDCERDELGIYIDHILPTLDIKEQIKVIERYIETTGARKIIFVREGDTDCILMCPENIIQTPAVQWKIGTELKIAKIKINILRSHFNSPLSF